MVFKTSIVLINIISGFMVFSKLFQGNEYEATKIIFPTESCHTVASGSNLTARCRSDSLAFWNKRDKVLNYEMLAYDDIEGTEDEIVGQTVDEILELTAITYQDVGFYDCGRKHLNSLFLNSSFYLFVDDPVHLIVGPQVVRMHIPKDKPLILPCRTTTQDVAVNLFTSIGTAMSFSLNPFDENEKLYFDPRRGFIIPIDQVPVNWSTYLCEFTKRGVRQEMKIYVIVESGTTDSFAYLERQVGTGKVVTAKLGSDVQFVAEVFSNINFHHRITWFDNTRKPISRSEKYSFLHSLNNDMWETQLRIHNVTESDVGIYTVSCYNNQLEFELKIEDPKIMMHTEMVYFHPWKSAIVTCLVNSSRENDIKWSFRHHGCQGNRCDFKIDTFTQGKLMENNKKRLAGMVTIQRSAVGNITCSFEDKDNHTISVTKPFVPLEIEDGFGIMKNIKAQNYEMVATLTCVVSLHLYLNHVYWIGPDGFVIQKNYTVGFTNVSLVRSETQYSYKVELRFLNVTEALDGKYRCMAVDYNHVPTLKNYDLRIPAGLPPKIVKSNLKNTTLTVEYPTQVNLTCSTEGFPEPTIQWFMDESHIGAGHNGVLGPVEKSGLYKCQIFNEYGVEERYTQLKIDYMLEAPVTLTHSMLDLATGQNITLYCHSDGYRISKVTWYKDTKLIECSRISFSESRLTIHSATVDDVGLYSCIHTADNAQKGATVKRNYTVPYALERIKNYETGIAAVVGFVGGIIFLSAIVNLLVRIIRLRRSGALEL